MQETKADQPHSARPDNSQERWARGVDFSGTTVVLGAASGQLLQILGNQIASSQGQLIALDFQPLNLKPLQPQLVDKPATLIQARFRSIPLIHESVDLIVANGIIREAPAERLDRVAEEFWRVLVPGGTLRVSDIIAPTEDQQDAAWALRNQIVETIGKLVRMPTALYVDIAALARALGEAGFGDLSASFLPGYTLTEAWLEETVNGLRRMTSRVVDRSARDEILQIEIPRLIDAFAKGDQRAAKRFVLSGLKPGGLALEMRASFVEEDLTPED